MTKQMKIDFVSDISCPWCIIGLRGLEEALARTGDLIDARIHFQPFELNPTIALLPVKEALPQLLVNKGWLVAGTEADYVLLEPPGHHH